MGGQFKGGKAQLRLVPGAGAGAPTRARSAVNPGYRAAARTSLIPASVTRKAGSPRAGWSHHAPIPRRSSRRVMVLSGSGCPPPQMGMCG
jgi:hypothetical protein